MKPRTVARLLLPSKKADPATRAEAERKLSEVLGNGNRDCYARYVHNMTQLLSSSQLRLLVEKFTSGGQYEFEKTLERLFGGRPAEKVNCYPRAIIYGDDLWLVK